MSARKARPHAGPAEIEPTLRLELGQRLIAHERLRETGRVQDRECAVHGQCPRFLPYSTTSARTSSTPARNFPSRSKAARERSRMRRSLPNGPRSLTRTYTVRLPSLRVTLKTVP